MVFGKAAKRTGLNGTNSSSRTETEGPFFKKVTPLGKFPANALGLHDMHENVYEWCSDWYRDYPARSVKDPIGPMTGSFCVYLGGSWDNGAVYYRSAGRGRDDPANRNGDFGFRVALSSTEIHKYKVGLENR